MVRHACRWLQKQLHEQNTHIVIRFSLNKQQASNSASGLDQPVNDTIDENNSDGRFSNEANSSSDDECDLFTQPNSQENNLPFSQSNVGIEFESYCGYTKSNREFFSAIEDADISSDDDGGQSVLYDDEEVSVGSVDLDCDDDVDVEV